MDDTSKYLIWSHEHMAWWSGMSSYTTSLERACRYEHQTALDICAKAIPGTAAKFGVLP